MSTSPDQSGKQWQDTQDQTRQGKSPSSQDLSFNTDASRLANDLIGQTGLSTDKAVEISKILEDYRNDIAEARTKNNYFSQRQQSDQEKDVVGSTGSQRPETQDMSGILGDNVQQYYADASKDLMKEYKEVDKKADKKISKVFDNDVQKSRYEQVKSQWWSDVKQKVFTSLEQQEMQNNGQQQQDWKSNTK